MSERMFRVGFIIFFIGNYEHKYNFVDKTDQKANDGMRSLIDRIKNETNIGTKCLEIPEFKQVIFLNKILKIKMFCEKI